MDASELHRRTVAEFVTRLGGAADRWEAPTPCPAWDVRALVNHVVGEDLWTVPLMDGDTVDQVGDRFEGDVLGADPIAAARAAAEAAVDAAGRGLAAGRVVHLSFGDAPAEEYAYQLAADHLVHGWDLAAATGGDRALDPELAEALSPWFAEREELYRAVGVIGARPPGAASSGPLEDLLVAFGRDPGWKA